MNTSSVLEPLLVRFLNSSPRMGTFSMKGTLRMASRKFSSKSPPMMRDSLSFMATRVSTRRSLMMGSGWLTGSRSTRVKSSELMEGRT